jgi:hypothetical protein
VAPPVADAFAAIDALLVTFASVTATAAAIAAEPPAAEPSAFEAAAAVSDDVTVSTPPTDTVIPPWSVAFAEAVAIVTAIAAATDTGPVDVDADGAAPALDPEPPLPDERLPEFERSPATWPSTPPDGAELDVPFADAVAEPFVELVPVAVKVAAPVTLSERLLVAVTACVASVTATAAPTAAVAAVAEPEAVVVTDAVCVAETVSAPPSVAVPPEPIDASVVTVEIDTATDGTIATPPPAAPLVDVVVIVSVLVAVSVRLCALSVAPFAIAARVVSVTRLSATAAPTPEPVVPAVAFAEETVVDVALNVASAVGALRPPESSADVWTFAIVKPNEPAKPTEPAAPEIPSLEKPAPPLVASTSTDPAAAVPATDASLVTSASVIATPAAAASAPPVAAEPSALAAAAAVSEAVIVSAPPTVNTAPLAIVAFADAPAIVTATAAATDTGPLDVEADGVPVEPEPDPPLPEEMPLAFERSPATWPSTPPTGAPGAPSPGAPFADAVAVPFVDVVPEAAMVAAPVTFSERLLVAVTSCSATVTATAAPTAAVAADAEPEADVVTAAVCVAVTTRVPLRVVRAPVPSDASVVTVESDTATDGTNATPPPAAPLTDVVVIVFVLVAFTVRFCALNVDPSARAACVVSVTRLSATAAPTPEPVVPAVAFAEEVVDDVALNVALPDGALAPPDRSARVCTFAIVSPSEPATPTDAAAPEIASLE